jgi:hypothetical protein
MLPQPLYLLMGFKPMFGRLWHQTRIEARNKNASYTPSPSAVKRFIKKMMRAEHRRLPFTIGTDKHASYPEAFAASIKDKVLPTDCKLRRVNYLNNIIEPDHRAIRRRWRAMQCFRSFHTAERTIEGLEAMHVLRKGQVTRLDGMDAVGQAKFVESLFCIAA